MVIRPRPSHLPPRQVNRRSRQETASPAHNADADKIRPLHQGPGTEPRWAVQEGESGSEPGAEGGGNRRRRQEGTPAPFRASHEGGGMGAEPKQEEIGMVLLIDRLSHALAQQWPGMAQYKGTQLFHI